MSPAHDPFANVLYSASEKCVDTVIVDGRILVRAGKLVHLDTVELHGKAAEISGRLIRQTGARPIQAY